MDRKQLQTLYLEHVATFLQYRVGGQLAERITAFVLEQDFEDITDARLAFRRMLQATLEYAIGPHRVFPLVFDKAELAGFENKFASIIDDAAKEGGASSFDAIFDELVAPYLEDILGRELVVTVKKVFMKAVSAIPDQPLDVRFYMGMQAVYHFLPDVWSELEFAEKVKNLSRLLPQSEEEFEPEEESGSAIDFGDLIEKIIVADLADILGRGHAMETVMHSAEAKTDGIFYNDLDRFEKFVENVLADDFITRMFDGFWVDDCRKKWMREAEFMLG